MIRLSFILVVAVLVGLSAAWLADHDQAMTVIIGTYEIRTTAEVAAVLLLILFAMLWLLLRILMTIVRSFGRTAKWVAAERKSVPVPPAPDP